MAKICNLSGMGKKKKKSMIEKKDQYTGERKGQAGTETEQKVMSSCL